MKILHVYDGHEQVAMGQGSVPYVVLRLAEESARLGHEVIVIERKWNNTLAEERKNGVLFKRVKISFGSDIPLSEPVYSEIGSLTGVAKIVLSRLSFSFKAIKLIKAENYDIIHFHLPFASNLLVRLSKKVKNRSIYTAHIGQEKMRFSIQGNERFLFKVFNPDLSLIDRAKRTVLLNHPLRDALIEKGVSAIKLKVISNGVQKELLSVSPEVVQGIVDKYKANGPNLVYSGSVFPRKGLHTLLKALTLVKNRYHLFIVGRTDVDLAYYNELEIYAVQNSLNVTFTGLVDYEELCAFYQIADIGVLPSSEEGDGISLKEMMAVGKPLIGSRVGGIQAQIVEGKNGYLFENGNHEELAAKLDKLLENTQLRKDFSAYSLVHAENFTWQKITEQYIQAYEEVLAQ